jgi:hypothetical protein
VQSVAWSNDRGGWGTAAGTTSWSVASVALQTGANVITVTATDDDGLWSTDVVTITYNAVAPDTAAPYVSQQSPAPASTNVALDANLSCHVLDAGAGVNQASIVVAVNGATVSPTISGTSADTIVFYDPPADFSALQTVTVSVTADDLATTPNRLSTSWSFRTLDPVAPDTTPPALSGRSPASGATGVARNTAIRFHLTDARSGVDQGSVVLRVDGSIATPSLSGTPQDLDVLYDPPAEFASLATVNVSVDASDEDGNAMPTVAWSFTCSEIVIEPPPPPSNLVAYPSSNVISLRFSPSAGTNVIGYYLYYRNGTGGYVQVNLGGATSWFLTDLEGGRTYYLCVTAYDTADQESAPMPEIAVTTLGAPVAEEETPRDDFRVCPNRAEIADLGGVRVTAPANYAWRKVRVYAVSGNEVATLELAEDASGSSCELAPGWAPTTGLYILAVEGETARARLVVVPSN